MAYRSKFKFTCPTCQKRGSSTDLECKNCGKKAVRASFYGADGIGSVYVGCARCQTPYIASRTARLACPSCGTTISDKLIQKRGWF